MYADVEYLVDSLIQPPNLWKHRCDLLEFRNRPCVSFFSYFFCPARKPLQQITTTDIFHSVYLLLARLSN